MMLWRKWGVGEREARPPTLSIGSGICQVPAEYPLHLWPPCTQLPQLLAGSRPLQPAASIQGLILTTSGSVGGQGSLAGRSLRDSGPDVNNYSLIIIIGGEGEGEEGDRDSLRLSLTTGRSTKKAVTFFTLHLNLCLKSLG